MNPEIYHDERQGRFCAVIDGAEAYLSYVQTDERTLDFRHTFVPEELRGRQLAEQLVRYGFAFAKGQGFRVIPTCPYVRRLVGRDPDLQALTTA